MEKEDVKIEKEPIFPEESSSIIGEILESHGIIASQEEEDKKLIELLGDEKKEFEEINQSIADLPRAKMAKLVADYGYRIVTIEKIPARIEKDFGVDKERAQKITDELKAKVLDLVTLANMAADGEAVKKKAKKMKTISSDPGDNLSPSFSTKKNNSVKDDAYLEPIE